MNDFIDGINGEFIHINCDIFPITSFMYRDRKVLAKHTVLDLESYVLNTINKLKVGELNVEFFKKYSSQVIELVINEHGIVRISIKGESDERKETSTM